MKAKKREENACTMYLTHADNVFETAERSAAVRVDWRQGVGDLSVRGLRLTGDGKAVIAQNGKHGLAVRGVDDKRLSYKGGKQRTSVMCFQACVCMRVQMCMCMLIHVHVHVRVHVRVRVHVHVHVRGMCVCMYLGCRQRGTSRRHSGARCYRASCWWWQSPNSDKAQRSR